MDNGAASAIHHLARILIEQGVLCDDDIATAADRVDSDALDAPDSDKDDYAHAAHMLRAAILYARIDDPKPPRPSLRIVKSD